MTTETLVYTPWGWTRDIEELAEGVWRVWTPSHGGLKLSRKRWAEIPVEIRDAMFTPTFAEEDCEEPIVKTLLGLADTAREGYGGQGGGVLRTVRCRPAPSTGKGGRRWPRPRGLEAARAAFPAPRPG